MAPVKVFVAYDSKYGNTKIVAKQIAVGLNSVDGVEAEIGYVKEVEPQKIAIYNALVLGAPNHMGKPSRTFTKFMDTLADVKLEARWVAAFDTYFQRERNFEKAMQKIENQVTKKLPNLKLAAHGLSVKVTGINGPIADGELPKAEEFGKAIAASITSNQQAN
jgi:menaquinone-dependent protoporphyrinogen IX oxidase